MKYKGLSLFLLFFCFLIGCKISSNKKYVPQPYYTFIDENIEIKDMTEDLDNDTSNRFLPVIDDREFALNFPDGNDSIKGFIKKNIVYPDSSRMAKIEGQVIASFVIDGWGKVIDVNIEKGLSPDINKEVIRVLKSMPQWVWDEGVVPNRKIKRKMFIPVNFILQ